jgi:hypothetical protein
MEDLMDSKNNTLEVFDMGTKDRIQQILDEKEVLEKEYTEKAGLKQPEAKIAAWVDLFSAMSY